MMRRKTVVPPAPSDDDRHPGQREVDADRAVLAPELDQDEAGDDRRQREGQVDDRVDDRLAGEAVTDEEPGDDRAEDGVDRHHDQRADQDQLERFERGRLGDLVPEVADALAERFVGERRERQQDDDAQPEDDQSAAEARADPGQAEVPCPGRCDR
jgi:hypothetical protein